MAHASSASRDFGPYVGGSLSKSWSTVTQPGVNATLNGWGNALEVGLDLPFSENFGFNAGVEVGQKELRNVAQSSTYLDDTKINSKAVRGSFFYKSLYLGGSYQKVGADLTTISTTSGASSAHVDGDGTSYFAGYSIMYKNLLRANIEGESTQFNATGFTYSDYTVSLKIQFLIGGFLDHN
jgi:hypothetical protein